MTHPPIIVFYHCLFGLKENGHFEERPAAFAIVHEFISCLRYSGLLDECAQMIVGVNGGPESDDYARLIIPPKAHLVYHGLQSRAENLTIVEIEKWIKSHPRQEAYIFYGHAKGCTHPPESDYAKFSARWRHCMLRHTVMQWQQCVSDLNSGAEAVGVHWLTGQGSDRSQHYFAGNMYFARASFLATIPSIYTRARIQESGISAVESRYESEVHIGNGPRLPVIRDYATHGLMACP